MKNTLCLAPHKYFCKLDDERICEILDFISNFVKFNGKVVLEIGSGSGNFLRHLQGKGIQAYGIEIVPELARLAKDTILGDATRLPFKEACFDSAIAIDVIEHIKEQF
ncbi:MAG: class I SAM-dependent methyltransferase [Candidatus Jordarchaeaceae archaeon]